MDQTRIALVTGANKGTGLEIARQLGEIGHSVWLGCRDPERGERAAADLRARGVDANPLLLDVGDDASVRAAAGVFGKAGDRLDVLVNNAGIALGGAPRIDDVSFDDMRVSYEVNTIGPLRVTQAFLPFLRKSDGARVVMMSSSLGSISASLDPTSEAHGVSLFGYQASKSALNMVTVLLAKELLAENIKVNAVNPGYTATDLNGRQGHRSTEEGARIAVRLATVGAQGPTAGFFHDGYFDQPGRHGW